MQALKDVELALWPGETLGLVGESGSGKSTFAKVLLGLTVPDPGSRLRLDAQTLAPHLAHRPAEAVKALQIVFQNPDSALNRSHSVRRIVGRALTKLAGLRGAEQRARTAELTASVRLSARYLEAKPRQLSGGLKQRVAIARAFAGEPRVVVCDEPTSALDVSVQAAILNLLAELQAAPPRQLPVHLPRSWRWSDTWPTASPCSIWAGSWRSGPSESVIAGPHHPYTHALLSAVPALDGTNSERIRLAGEIPSAVRPAHAAACSIRAAAAKSAGSASWTSRR